MDADWLPTLRDLAPPQRAELLGIAHTTYDAIDALNAVDEFGKACCWLGADDEPATVMEQLVKHVATHDLQAFARAKDGAAPAVCLSDRSPRTVTVWPKRRGVYGPSSSPGSHIVGGGRRGGELRRRRKSVAPR